MERMKYFIEREYTNGGRVRIYGTPEEPLFLVYNIMEWVKFHNITVFDSPTFKGKVVAPVEWDYYTTSHGTIFPQTEVLLTISGLKELRPYVDKDDLDRYIYKCVALITEYRMTLIEDGE